MDKEHIEYKIEHEDSLQNEPLISFIDNDFVLNFLNDFDHPSKPNFDHIQLNSQIFSNDLPINDSRINNFPLEGFNKFSIENNNNNNPFYLQNESFNFTQNNKTPNNVFGLPQSQMKGIFQNEDKDHPMFNAQSLAYSENFNPKSCIKNTYINKINNLMSNSLNEFKFNEEKKKAMIKIEPNSKLNPENGVNFEVNNQEIKEEDVDYSKLSELDKLNLKLKRNRESARNSRKRKKIYIDLLETKVTELSDELALANKQLEINAINLSKMSSQARMINNLMTERQSLFEKLDKGINTNLEENELNLLIDSLRLRLGASGKDRVNVLNFFFKRFFNLFLPPYIRYLLWVSLLDKDIFAEDFAKNDIKMEENQKIGTNLLQKYPVSENFKKMIPKYKKKFISSYSKVGSIVDSINKMKDDLLKETNNLENILDEFRNIYKPRDIGSFLLDVEKVNKSCKLYSSYNLFLKKDKSSDSMNEEDDDEDDEMDEEINLKAEEDNDDDEIKYKAYSMNFESEQINGNFKEGQAPLKLTKSQYKRKKRHTESDDDNI